jgi:protein-disulfide isomerase
MAKNSLKINKLSSLQIIIAAVVISAVVNLVLTKLFFLQQGSGSVDSRITAYVENNPEEILESINKFLQDKQKNVSSDRYKNIAKNKKAIFEENAPFVGPKNSDKIVVEFFDYNCGYCKRAFKTVEQIVAKNPDVKVIFKELPILGASSRLKSQVAIASFLINPKKYFEVHKYLLEAGRSESKSQLADGLIKFGFSSAEILDKMDSKKVGEFIVENIALSRKLGVNGTPAFIVNDKIFDGAVGYDKIIGTFKK